ncbi:MAG: metal ABC transporter ATP-binding protein [Zetaproteobacteria bacterium]|nr:metal ABC transporter ATP-binding protein [Zetaproteobacteria bacterium]
MNKAPVIELSHVSFGPKHAPILKDIHLTLNAGHFMAIVGPNAAGKSTLISIIAGLITPAHGHIDLFGQCMNRFNKNRIRKHIGFLHQLHDHEPRLPMRVDEVVAMGLAEYASPLWKPLGNRQAIEDALRHVDMLEHIHRDFRQLSGGQRQRVRLARALVRKPRLLILDEPAAALDSKQQEALYRQLRNLCDTQGTAIIMVEHDIAAISDYVDSVACLNQRIHHHAMRGESIPDEVWQAMYGEHINIMAHDKGCIGCHEPPKTTHSHARHSERGESH